MKILKWLFKPTEESLVWAIYLLTITLFLAAFVVFPKAMLLGTFVTLIIWGLGGAF